ncbi:hypothetical protein GOP47_0021377 [Adiantum capillus-veneris]|uniref:Uncharacterized protein n=1 Tax=Adiantum capillus-veneris TaxID=13818 RepID=A0A9D4Z6G3_ADICA|nr:hypothetical protein GOP47_0021377 [Adiantum capillus-veneris]
MSRIRGRYSVKRVLASCCEPNEPDLVQFCSYPKSPFSPTLGGYPRPVGFDLPRSVGFGLPPQLGAVAHTLSFIQEAISGDLKEREGNASVKATSFLNLIGPFELRKKAGIGARSISTVFTKVSIAKLFLFSSTVGVLVQGQVNLLELEDVLAACLQNPQRPFFAFSHALQKLAIVRIWPAKQTSLLEKLCCRSDCTTSLVNAMNSVEIPVDTTCGSLLRELQHIWDEVGESDGERDKMLLQLEQECLEVYRKKVDQASHSRARLHQAIADAEAEIALLISALGEHGIVVRDDKRGPTLKEQLVALHPLLEELRKKKEERLKQFAEAKEHIQKILVAISGSSDLGSAASFSSSVDKDLSLGRLDEYLVHLQALQKEKEERLQKVSESVSVIHELCSILAMDSMKIVKEVNPSLCMGAVGSSDVISDSILDILKRTIESLRLEKTKRLHKLQELATSLIELWNLMDSPKAEQNDYLHIMNMVGTTEADMISHGDLSLKYIQQAETEVQRLEKLKVTKVKELVVKKQTELNSILMAAHMEPDPDASQEKILAIIDSGVFDASELLGSFDQQIAIAKEEALSRKEIMEKMDRWVAACEEECWLEEYNRDENRYNASRGAHINLKRAEKARITIQKLPSMLENLIQKTKTWEEEHKSTFLFNGMRLLDVLEEQNIARKEKDHEKKRMRDQRKLQEQMATEQEAVFGAKPSPLKPVSAKKGLSVRANGNGTPIRRASLGGGLLQSEAPRKNGLTPGRVGKDKKDKTRPTAPVNFVAIAKEDPTAV